MGKLIYYKDRDPVPDCHPMLSAADEVTQICQPFFNDSIINYFDFARLYPDGSVLEFSSNGIFNKYAYENGFYILSTIPEEKLGNLRFYYAAAAQNLHPWFTYSRDMFGIDNRIILFEKFRHHTDIYTFATNPTHNQAINFYLNNIDILKKFSTYYKEKAKKLFQIYEAKKFIPENKLRRNNHIEIVKSFSSADPLLLNFNKVGVSDKKASCIPASIENKLTKREIECLRYLLLGYTAKETAKNLTLSSRTVETHINNIKHKLNCFSKRKIIQLLYNF